MKLPLDAAGGIRSLGRQLLLAALERTTQRELARNLSRRCGRKIYQRHISDISTGKIISDSYRLRMALWGACGIHPDAWEQPDDATRDAA